MHETAGPMRGGDGVAPDQLASCGASQPRWSIRVLAAVAATAGLAAAAQAGVLPTAGAATGAATGGWCGSSQLTGSFSELRGSAGAGHVTYVLKLTNRSSTSCRLSGMPGLQLLAKRGGKLPTSTFPSMPGAGSAILITLTHGPSAWASGRFSPDVPSAGESTTGPCEKTAYSVRVTLPQSGESLTAPITPPTAVCDRGHILVSLLGTAKPKM